MDQIYHDVANNLFRVTMTRLATLEEILATLPQELIHQTFGQFDGGSITVSSPELGQGMMNLPPLPGMLPPEQGEPGGGGECAAVSGSPYSAEDRP